MVRTDSSKALLVTAQSASQSATETAGAIREAVEFYGGPEEDAKVVEESVSGNLAAEPCLGVPDLP